MIVRGGSLPAWKQILGNHQQSAEDIGRGGGHCGDQYRARELDYRKAVQKEENSHNDKPQTGKHEERRSIATASNHTHLFTQCKDLQMPNLRLLLCFERCPGFDGFRDMRLSGGHLAQYRPVGSFLEIFASGWNDCTIALVAGPKNHLTLYGIPRTKPNKHMGFAVETMTTGVAVGFQRQTDVDARHHEGTSK